MIFLCSTDCAGVVLMCVVVFRKILGGLAIIGTGIQNLIVLYNEISAQVYKHCDNSNGIAFAFLNVCVYLLNLILALQVFALFCIAAFVGMSKT